MSKYKYQVVVHYQHYPSSILFESEAEALLYYESVRGVEYEDENPLITVCKILQSRGVVECKSEIDWYLNRGGL